MEHTIFLVDDNEVVRDALTLLINEDPGFTICGVAETAIEAIEEVARIGPDLALVDYSLPGMNGIELIERLAIRKPAQRIAMLSAHTDPSYVDRALAAGAVGYFLKQEVQALIAGIRRVVDGEVFVSPTIPARPPRLSGKEG